MLDGNPPLCRPSHSLTMIERVSGNDLSRPPKWIKPQLTRLVDEAPAGTDWLHEIKYDGYGMHARIDGGQVKLLTRAGLDWSNCKGTGKSW